MNKTVVALTWLLASVLRRLLKVTLVLTVISVVFLVFFVNFYSYSSLTRFVYSIEWLLKYTPLIQNGELVIPPAISLLFHHLHALKLLASRASSAIYNDGYPDFAGKYHWNREELRQCTLQNEMFREQESDPRLQCQVHQSMLLFIRTEVLSVNPPIVKYHQLLPMGQVEDFIRETDAVQMAQGTIMVKDSLNRNIWQDSLVVNGTFIRHSHSPPLVSSFNHMQNRIGAINLAKSEMFHVKKYRPGGHYAPHLDYLVVMPPGEDHLGNRIATLMLILKPAELGGGTVFPNAGVHFRPAAGDALLWMNMNPDYSVAQGSFHGACPVLAGTKIGVTMWIRSAGQELRMPCPLTQNEHFDTRLFTHFAWRPKTFWAYLDCYIRPDRKCAHPKLKRGRYTV